MTGQTHLYDSSICGVQVFEQGLIHNLCFVPLTKLCSRLSTPHTHAHHYHLVLVCVFVRPTETNEVIDGIVMATE